VARRIRDLFDLLSRRARMGLGLTVMLLIVERLILAAGAFGLAGRLTLTWAATAGVVAFWALRGLVRQGVVKETREKLTMLIAEAALERGGDGSFLQGEEADAAVFEGRNVAEQVIVRHLPPLVAEPIAVAVLLIVLRPSGVPIVAGAGAVVVAAALLAVLRNATVARQRGAWRKYMDVARDTLTSIRAAPELIASGHEREYLEKLRQSVDEWTTIAARAERNAAVFQRIPFAAVVIVGVMLIAQTRALELGQLIRLAVFFPPIAGLMRTVFELVKMAPRVGVLGPALDVRRERVEKDAARAGSNVTGTPLVPPTLQPPPQMPCEIRFENVGFSYGDVQVLKNVSFVWKPGEILGIKGPNGSGKSTLLKLMLGLLVPTEGKILVGGVDLREIDLNAWRRGIAYLPQRPYVPEKATVLEAMRLTAPGLTEEEARRGLEELGVWERLETKAAYSAGPPGIEPIKTPICPLSVGVRQRVILARTFGAGAQLLVLDEPDENLDSEARAVLVRHLHSVRSKQLIVIATHDAALLNVCRISIELGMIAMGGGSS
jgi:ABC-type multidrug transport system fused ATPase/permease subunit